MHVSSPNEETQWLHDSYEPPSGFSSLSTPVHHASTVVFDTVDAYQNRGARRYDGYTYGLSGTPTSMVLAHRVAQLEASHHQAVLTPSGLSAISLVYLSCLRQGDHVLVSDNVYGPSRHLCLNVLQGMGVEISFYDALAGSGIESQIRSNTRLIWVESPGSITMEIADVSAIAAIGRKRGILVAADNTWAAGLHFKPLRHGCDISVQALTKYVGGHSDLLLGAIAVSNEILYRKIKDTAHSLGLGVSSQDCFLALRGLSTLSVRMRQHQASALEISRWLQQRSEIKKVIHPALASCPGHEIWRRDFSGSSGLFSIVLQPQYSKRSVDTMIERLRYFRIGASWGGAISLALPLDPSDLRTAAPWNEDGYLIRLSIGLENVADLIADLRAGLDSLLSVQAVGDRQMAYKEG
ncbi:cystathionine beta-lyase [Noviherbaspirillum saxi]|uniref:Cystathionine beta-lyase n=1 Tax=Noviherbaspirillum saxi TaxID=2320863 RepID=A0A3A3FSV3_9BURK|nr:cystathionine beta-lyase [Noviherbaspirillum saxi]RJF99297.1 cystathionine beta-lyase [Noviherbaspirillum saxi]